MTNTQTPTPVVWTHYRMNDYVGVGIYATLTWFDVCRVKGTHTYGHLSGCCISCRMVPTVKYETR